MDNSTESILPLKDQLLVPNLTMIDETAENSEEEENLTSIPSSRRPSQIIAALRRPSQAVALSAAHAVMHQRRYLLGLLHTQSEGALDEKKVEKKRRKSQKMGDGALTVVLSALYAKILVVLGMALPITEIISKSVPPFYYQGFYLYLYFGSILFVIYLYFAYKRDKLICNLINTYNSDEKLVGMNKKPIKYGSFYLRLGAIAFGIGSMVYSALEFGRYFELKNNEKCSLNILQAITPVTRIILSLVQIQFIFLNTKNLEMDKHLILTRFGLMHMVAANLCEWLYILVEETRHEIIHLGEHHYNVSNVSLYAKYCQEGYIMGDLVRKASPFLFPCKIEYSLICAVILFEMWKKVKLIEEEKDKIEEKYSFNPFIGNPVNPQHHFSVDCSNAHKGLFWGIMVIVLTIISLIMFFVLVENRDDPLRLGSLAEFEVNVAELAHYLLTSLVVIIAMVQMRVLKYERKVGGEAGIGLDNTLLVIAQSGLFIYSMFSVIGCYFTLSRNTAIGLITEVFSFVQTSLQTMFVLDGWNRRCRNLQQLRKKPGKELITFLIIANMAMWAINTLEKSRAEFRPSHLKFFGAWAWTIITHVSMPMAIFYRFHSTICLFEIWKSAYKIKSPSRVYPLLVTKDNNCT